MSYELIHDATELRKLIAENPDLPIVVLASEEANSGEWGWQYCNNVSCCIKEILDIRTPFDRDDTIFDDRDEFEEAIGDCMYYKEPYKSMTNGEFDAAVHREASMYDGYWKKVIAVYVSN